MTEYDVLVVGGGINGAGIARDAAGRGMKTLLCEKDDLGSHTSSASTKLIHGGLRYLEQFEFGLVRKALLEREVLLKSAPHIMWPLKFIMPHDQMQRPAWMIRIGLFLYDRLAVRALLPASCLIDLRAHTAGGALKDTYVKGFQYADGWVDDARLVVLTALDAHEKGAMVLTHTRFVSAIRKNSQWEVKLCSREGQERIVKATNLVNATGPWAGRFAASESDASAARHQKIRMIKGSHIVVPRLFDHPDAYIFQNIDRRIVFAIPYEHDFTLIGTTDVDYTGDLDDVGISEVEIVYLCDAVNRYFSRPVGPDDVRWSFAGVRPLHEDSAANASKVTRDYHLELDRNGASMLNVFGGKLTTYRKLAEEAVDMLSTFPGLHPSRKPGHWTADACLPGGDLFGPIPSNRSVRDFDTWVKTLQAEYPWLRPVLTARYARAYGTRTRSLLGDAACMDDLGVEIVTNIHEAEVRYLIRHEWARCAEDILWRRSKCGLHLPSDAAEKLDRWMKLHMHSQQ